MVKRMPTHCKDETCASCVVAGDTIYLAHHAGGFSVPDIAHQTRAAFESMKATLASVGATLDDVAQINYYIRDTENFRKGADVFAEYFRQGGVARMTITSDFIDPRCLCMIDGIAYKPSEKTLDTN
ncbi:RidA family protein [Lacrimispora brassicae]